jgi:hypothetical protein
VRKRVYYETEWYFILRDEISMVFVIQTCDSIHYQPTGTLTGNGLTEHITRLKW